MRRPWLQLLICASVIFLAVVLYFFGWTGGPLRFARLSSVITVLHYPNLNLFFDSNGRLIGYEQFGTAASVHAQKAPPVPLRVSTPSGVLFGSSPEDIERRFGSASGIGYGRSSSSPGRIMTYAYWTVDGQRVDVHRGLRYFQFSERKLDRVGELFTTFRLSPEVAYGSSRSAVTKAYGSPASVGKLKESPFIAEFRRPGK